MGLLLSDKSWKVKLGKILWKLPWNPQKTGGQKRHVVPVLSERTHSFPWECPFSLLINSCLLLWAMSLKSFRFDHKNGDLKGDLHVVLKFHERLLPYNNTTLNTYTWISNWHLKLNMSKIKLLIVTTLFIPLWVYPDFLFLVTAHNSLSFSGLKFRIYSWFIFLPLYNSIQMY